MESLTTQKKVPKTVRERVQKFRAKKKQQEGYQRSENIRIEGIRKKRVAKMSESEKDSYRMSTAERKRKSRAKKLLSVSNSMNGSASQSQPEPSTPVTPRTSAYARPQSLGKAVRKSVRSLPY